MGGAKEIALAEFGEALLDSLNKYGVQFTTDFLVRSIASERRNRNFRNEVLLEELLTTIPTLCALSEFMYGKPVIKVQ